MANQIKNKYTVPSVTEFSTKDLVIDITRGKLYYKSNYVIYELTGKLISTNITDPSFLNLIEGDTTTTTGGGSVTINSDADNRVITALGTGQLQA